MPELPEVETIKRGLAQKLHGLEIKEVRLPFYKSFIPYENPEVSKGSKAGRLGNPPKKLVQEINRYMVGAKVGPLSRQGKVMIMELSNGFALLVHLKMTGQLVLVETDGDRFAGGHPTESMQNKLPDSSTRIIFVFNDNTKLFFNDQRKFGWIKLVKKKDINKETLLAKMGKDPTRPGFSGEYLFEQLKSRGINIKAALLDQKTLAGVGNIYADEALHKAKIHPKTPANSLSKESVGKLAESVQEVLQKAISLGGTSFTNYVNALGKKGDYMQQARVFGRTGHACSECGNEIKKIKVATRGTHYCPKCQKEQK